VFGAQLLERRFGLVRVLGVALAAVALDLLAGAILIDDQAALIAVVILSGAFLGIVNTVLTQAVMAAATVERPIASSAYSFVRFTGGAVAPWIAGKLAEHVSAGTPLYLGAAMVGASVLVLAHRRTVLAVAAPAEVVVEPVAPHLRPVVAAAT
jgi:predicted MFS family arabinose efflux permease